MVTEEKNVKFVITAEILKGKNKGKHGNFENIAYIDSDMNVILDTPHNGMRSLKGDYIVTIIAGNNIIATIAKFALQKK